MGHVMNVAFYVAGAALLMHLIICWLLKTSLAANEEALRDLFAIPNQRLVGNPTFQLLRVSHYLPWKTTSIWIKSMNGSRRVMLGLRKLLAFWCLFAH